jgi:hypothetical protein
MLTAAGITAQDLVGWSDEMRIGLFGTTRRVWGRRGVKVRQRLQLVRVWRYLHLVVDPLQGRLWWFWSQRMQATVTKQLCVATSTETDLGALVWDRAPSHRDAAVRAVGFPLIQLPPYAPELNPAERVFEELRAGIEGIVYPTIGAKMDAVEAILMELDADPERVKRLTGWWWIAEALHSLPQKNAA